MTLFDFLVRFSCHDEASIVYGVPIQTLFNGGSAERYQRAVIQGDVQALFAFALYQSTREEALGHVSAAAPMFEMAAQHGHVGAQVFMGRMCESGSGIAQNDKQAVGYLQLAAAQGDQDAQYHLGLLYAAGRGGLPASDAQAFKYFSLSTDQGNAAAQWALGKMYAQGDEVAQDYLKARAYFQLSADQGHPEAMEWLGQLYAEGLGVVQSAEQAQWYAQKARTQKALRAQSASPIAPAEHTRQAVEPAQAGFLGRIQALMGLVKKPPK